MNWILIVVVLGLVVLFFKAHEVRHRFFAMAIILLVLFFLVTFASVALQPGVDFKTFEGVTSAGKVYLAWLGHAFGNVKSITGNAVALDWAPNATNVTRP